MPKSLPEEIQEGIRGVISERNFVVIPGKISAKILDGILGGIPGVLEVMPEVIPGNRE